MFNTDRNRAKEPRQEVKEDESLTESQVIAFKDVPKSVRDKDRTDAAPAAESAPASEPNVGSDRDAGRHQRRLAKRPGDRAPRFRRTRGVGHRSAGRIALLQ